MARARSVTVTGAEESMADSEMPDTTPAGAAQGDTPETIARALVAVRGMDTDDARRRVHAALAAVAGVHAVVPGDGGKMVVDYDPSETTVMDLIRALRRIGFLAGMD